MTNVQGQPQTASTGGLFAIYADQYARSITLRFSSLLRDFGRRSVDSDQPICCHGRLTGDILRANAMNGNVGWREVILRVDQDGEGLENFTGSKVNQSD